MHRSLCYHVSGFETLHRYLTSDVMIGTGEWRTLGCVERRGAWLVAWQPLPLQSHLTQLERLRRKQQQQQLQQWRCSACGEASEPVALPRATTRFYKRSKASPSDAVSCSPHLRTLFRMRFRSGVTSQLRNVVGKLLCSFIAFEWCSWFHNKGEWRNCFSNFVRFLFHFRNICWSRLR